MTIILIGLIGYMAALTGFFFGAVFSAAAAGLGKKFHGSLMGFTAGLLIAFVCFEMIPVAFEHHGLATGFAGIIAGVILSAWAEGRINETNISKESYKMDYIKTGMVVGMSVMLHKLPEGMAVGSKLGNDFGAGISFAVIIAIHCFPEAVAVTLPLKKGGFSIGKIMAVCMVICAPMGIGSVLGALMSNISDIFISLCLALSSGVMLYITCGEVLPESKDIWRGRLTTVCACAGFLAGIILTAVF